MEVKLLRIACFRALVLGKKVEFFENFECCCSKKKGRIIELNIKRVDQPDAYRNF
jgi:hypothetical protein